MVKPQKICPPRVCECIFGCVTLIEKRVFVGIMKMIKMRLSRTGMSLPEKTSVIMREEKRRQNKEEEAV